MERRFILCGDKDYLIEQPEKKPEVPLTLLAHWHECPSGFFNLMLR